ncbi:hypothetical protein KY345_03955 [Candidatus Woesearchaeota archaeon]|nr:hypothetical protein [Candidatus Woesearchaeota archaeon]
MKHTRPELEMRVSEMLKDTSLFPNIDDHAEIRELADEDKVVQYLSQYGVAKEEAMAVMNLDTNSGSTDSRQLAEQALNLHQRYQMSDYVQNGCLIAGRGYEQMVIELERMKRLRDKKGKKIRVKPAHVYFIAEVTGQTDTAAILDIATHLDQYIELINSDDFATRRMEVLEKYSILRGTLDIDSIREAQSNQIPAEEVAHMFDGIYLRFNKTEGTVENADSPLNRTTLRG